MQLPCFNEAATIRRAVDSAFVLEWPKDRF